MPLANVYFVWLAIPLALIFTIMAYVLKGMWWWAIVGGLLWMLLGMFSVTQENVFYFQDQLGVVFIVIGIAVLWTPAYFKNREQKTMAEQGDDLDHYTKEMDEFDNEIRRYRSLGRRKRPI